MVRQTPLFFGVKQFIRTCFYFSFVIVSLVGVQSAAGQTAANPPNVPDAAALDAGKSFERELAGGQKHLYQITLAADQYAKIIVEQRGVDLIVKLSDADGKPLGEYDAETRNDGAETVEFAAQTAGVYRLEIAAKYKLLPAGRYEIRFDEARPANEKDRALQAARSLYDQAAGSRRAGKSADGIASAARALEIAEKNLDAENPEIARVLNLLGNLYSDTSDFDKAEAAYQRALTIRTKAFGETNPNVAMTLGDLGVVYRLKGEPERAEPLYRKALAIREQIWGKEHPEIARTLLSLGNLALDGGDYVGAEKIYLQALAIRDKTTEPDNLLIVPTLNALGVVYGELGDYVKAVAMYQRALSVAEKNLPPEHPTIATSLDNLAGVYEDMGDFEKSEPMMKRALEIREKALGAEDLMVAASLNNIGNLYEDRGNYAEAEKAYSRSLEIREKKFKGNPHPYLAQSLFNLGENARKSGDLTKAENYLQRSLAVSEKVFGANHPSITYALLGLANVYRDTGDYEKAEPLYRRVLAIYDATFGAEHPVKAKILSAMAGMYLAKGDLTAATAAQTQANIIAEKSIALNLTLGSEEKKLVYLNSLTEMLNRTLTINAAAPDKKEAGEMALTEVLQRKGRVLDAMSDTLAVLRGRFNAEDRNLLDKLNETNTRLALLVLNAPERETLAEHERKVKDLETQRDNLEVEISRRAAGFYQGSKPITLEAVRRNIPENAALIEFAVYQPMLPSSKNAAKEANESRYAAYVVGRTGDVRMKDLGKAAEIDAAVESFRQSLFDPKRADAAALGKAVGDKIMKPLCEFIGDKKQILVSPDGQLNLIPFEALVDAQNHYLVEDYAFTYLTSGRDLLRLDTARTSKNKPVVVADPLFGDADSTALAVNAKTPVNRSKRRSITAARNLSDTYFAPLGGTLQEARSIQNIFPEAASLTGANATKAALKQVAAPQILHIATHGFFLQDGEVSPINKAKIENPLLRSGLALAGANRRDKTGDDGILTALEASGLNLWGTKLVVLSACDTGLGEVKNGEGVYGLRRSFVLAGAESMVMSLWSVSDSVTRELMTNYYKNLKAGMGRGAALRQVQLEMLKKKDRTHPFYWAAFIQSGEWANLDGTR